MKHEYINLSHTPLSTVSQSALRAAPHQELIIPANGCECLALKLVGSHGGPLRAIERQGSGCTQSERQSAGNFSMAFADSSGARVAEIGMFVPLDGGSPTEAEIEMCRRIAAAIRRILP
jgi:hypothetical protein